MTGPLKRRIAELEGEVALLRAYAGPGPYEPSEADGAKAPTWQELRDLADHNFRLYAEVVAERDAARDGAKALAETLHAVNMQIVEVTGSEDCIEEDGDGDWDAVYERLQELKGIREAAHQLAAERDHLADIAVRLARAIPRDGDLAHAHSSACADEYVGCLAARVIEERGRG